MGDWAVNLLCAMPGSYEFAGLELCAGDGLDGVSEQISPATKFSLPYQWLSVPTPRPLTKYHWRFRSNNGSHTSDWTNYSSFWRPL